VKTPESLPPEQSPDRAAALLWMGVAAATSRGCLLVLLAFGHDPNGAPLSAAPLLTLATGASVQLPPLLALGIVLYALARFVARLSKAALWAGVILFGLTLLVGGVDAGLVQYLGLRFTLPKLLTYGGSSLASWELVASLAGDLVFWVLVLASSLFGLAWILNLALRPRRRSRPVLATLLLAGVISLPSFGLDPVQYNLYMPAEALLVAGLVTGDREAPPLDPAQALLELRAGIERGGPVTWMDRAGLERQPPRDSLPALPADSLPDILIWSVESLRGGDVGFTGAGDLPSVTPVLDSLAREGIVLRRLIANGFPSSRGFFSVHTGLWPQRDRVTLSSNPDLRVDAIPERLGERGYARAIFWGSNPDFDNQLAWARGWYDRLEFETPGNRLLYTERVSDRELVDRVISFVEEHDRTEPGRPFLAFGSTAGTHFPFTEEDSYYAPLSALGDQSRVDPGDETDPAVRYRRVLGGMDAHFGRLVAALGRRARSDRTVIIVLGDHAFPTGPAGTGAQRALPLDDYVWTSALLIGPESLIGPPRTIDVPTAQTDLLPTILDLIRDPDPYVAVGHSVLGPLPPDREVVSVREGGLRVDRGNWSLYIPTHGPPWADRSLDGVLEPTSPDAAGFSAEDIRAWERRMSTWRWLVSGNRVKREH